MMRQPSEVFGICVELHNHLGTHSGEAVYAERQASAASGRHKAEEEKMIGRWSAASIC